MNDPSKTDLRVGSANAAAVALPCASLPVAHWMNSHAASLFFDAEFMANDQVHRLVA